MSVLQEKCSKYWPDKVNDTVQYGDFEVVMTQESKKEFFTIRAFALSLASILTYYESLQQ